MVVVVYSFVWSLKSGGRKGLAKSEQLWNRNNKNNRDLRKSRPEKQSRSVHLVVLVTS